MTDYNRLYEYYEYDKNGTLAIQQTYAKFFEGCTNVLDIACGRGEFLEILRAAGIGAAGVDSNQPFCNAVKAAGFEVACADVFEYLESAGEGSFDGIFISHFIEHLSYPDLERLFSLCSRVLGNNGRIVVTTPSVSSVGMHLDWFYRDPTHAGFRHPEAVSYVLKTAGFSIEESGGNPATLLPYLGEQAAGLQASAATLRRNKEDIETLSRELSGGDDDIAAAVKASLRTSGGLKSLVKRACGAATMLGSKPYIDEISRRQALLKTMYIDRLRDVNNELIAATDNVTSLIDKIDHSFEDYIVARKARA